MRKSPRRPKQSTSRRPWVLAQELAELRRFYDLDFLPGSDRPGEVPSRADSLRAGLLERAGHYFESLYTPEKAKQREALLRRMGDLVEDVESYALADSNLEAFPAAAWIDEALEERGGAEAVAKLSQRLSTDDERELLDRLAFLVMVLRPWRGTNPSRLLPRTIAWHRRASGVSQKIVAAREVFEGDRRRVSQLVDELKGLLAPLKDRAAQHEKAWGLLREARDLAEKAAVLLGGEPEELKRLSELQTQLRGLPVTPLNAAHQVRVAQEGLESLLGHETAVGRWLRIAAEALQREACFDTAVAELVQEERRRRSVERTTRSGRPTGADRKVGTIAAERLFRWIDRNRRAGHALIAAFFEPDLTGDEFRVRLTRLS
jgi:hypothetical protein